MLNPMWWLVALVIVGAAIYYLVASRGEIRDGEGRRLAAPGADQEAGEELSGEVGEVVAGIEDDENFVRPGMTADDTPKTSLTNLDAAAGIASRGMGGTADVDEEYGAGLDPRYPMHTAGMNGDGYDDDDEDSYSEDEPVIEGQERKDRVEDQTYMRADDVRHETNHDDRKVREFRRQDRR